MRYITILTVIEKNKDYAAKFVHNCLIKSFGDENEASNFTDEFREWVECFANNNVMISSIPVKNNDRILDFVVKYLRNDNNVSVSYKEIER